MSYRSAAARQMESRGSLKHGPRPSGNGISRHWIARVIYVDILRDQMLIQSLCLSTVVLRLGSWMLEGHSNHAPPTILGFSESTMAVLRTIVNL